jgi:hypothetical protein
MSKKIVILLPTILLFYFSVSNERGLHISSIELLDTGYNSSAGKMQISNYLLNLATNVIYITFILKEISLIFRLRIYIASRGGYNVLINRMIKSSLKNVFIILLVKQLVYIIFYFLSPSYSHFYIFNMISTFLTLSILALSIIITRLQGIKETLSFFSILSITALTQYMSYKYSIFSILVIASSNWKKFAFVVILFKFISLLVLFYLVFSILKPDKLIGRLEDD